MDENQKYITYCLLQNEYLKRQGISQNENLENIIPFFPEDWFSYKLDIRINFIVKALKENKKLEDILIETKHY